MAGNLRVACLILHLAEDNCRLLARLAHERLSGLLSVLHFRLLRGKARRRLRPRPEQLDLLSGLHLLWLRQRWFGLMVEQYALALLHRLRVLRALGMHLFVFGDATSRHCRYELLDLDGARGAVLLIRQVHQLFLLSVVLLLVLSEELRIAGVHNNLNFQQLALLESK